MESKAKEILYKNHPNKNANGNRVYFEKEILQSMEEYKNSVLLEKIKEIEKFIEPCQTQADIFKEADMITSQLSSLAMKFAYEQAIEILKKDI